MPTIERALVAGLLLSIGASSAWLIIAGLTG